MIDVHTYVRSGFLNGKLDEEILLEITPGVKINKQRGKVFHIRKELYVDYINRVTSDWPWIFKMWLIPTFYVSQRRQFGFLDDYFISCSIGGSESECFTLS